MNFSPQFLDELSMSIHEKIYGPGEIIFSKGDRDNKFFLILNGGVQYYIDKGKCYKKDKEVLEFK